MVNIAYVIIRHHIFNLMYIYLYILELTVYPATLAIITIINKSHSLNQQIR